MQCCDRFLYYYILTVITPSPTFSKPHYPSKIANTLASLVKGRWIDGKAQTVALLRFACDTLAFFYSPNFSAVKTEGLQHNPSLHQPFQNRTTPCSAPTPLPPLSKGGGLTARHKLFLCCVLLAIYLPFFIHQTFLPSRRRDCFPTAPSMRFSTLSLSLFVMLTYVYSDMISYLHYPSKSTKLASRRKRGGGTAVEFFGLMYSIQIVLLL